MIKLFAVDMDDTFLDKNDHMSKENIQAVRDLVDAGVKVIINSGRTEVLMREHIHDLGLEDFKHVAVNGALILDLQYLPLLHLLFHIHPLKPLDR